MCAQNFQRKNEKSTQHTNFRHRKQRRAYSVHWFPCGCMLIPLFLFHYAGFFFKFFFYFHYYYYFAHSHVFCCKIQLEIAGTPSETVMHILSCAYMCFDSLLLSWDFVIGFRVTCILCLKIWWTHAHNPIHLFLTSQFILIFIA